MRDNLDEQLQNTQFDWFHKKVKENDEKILDYKARGAVLNGERDLDKEYTAFLTEAAKFMLGFSKEELYTLLGRQIQESE